MAKKYIILITIGFVLLAGLNFQGIFIYRELAKITKSNATRAEHPSKRKSRMPQAKRYDRGTFEKGRVPMTTKREIEQLKKLREENPEKFQQLMKKRRAKLKEKLAYLKEHDPEKFAQLQNKFQNARTKRLKELKHTDPEAFRKEIDKLKQLKNNIEKNIEKLEEESEHK
ncbi:MAG: hypothetical protein Q7J67_10030 [bacterium]|nr:hypothetical protein [bacterium]